MLFCAVISCCLILCRVSFWFSFDFVGNSRENVVIYHKHKLDGQLDIFLFQKYMQCSDYKRLYNIIALILQYHKDFTCFLT